MEWNLKIKLCSTIDCLLCWFTTQHTRKIAGPSAMHHGPQYEQSCLEQVIIQILLTAHWAKTKSSLIPVTSNVNKLSNCWWATIGYLMLKDSALGPYARYIDLSRCIPVKALLLSVAVLGLTLSFSLEAMHLLSSIRELFFTAKSSLIRCNCFWRPSRPCLENQGSTY